MGQPGFFKQVFVAKEDAVLTRLDFGELTFRIDPPQAVRSGIEYVAMISLSKMMVNVSPLDEHPDILRYLDRNNGAGQ